MSFSPASITGCALWLDAADATTVSGNVTSWRDKINNLSFTPRSLGNVSYSNNRINISNGAYLMNTSGNINVPVRYTFFLVASSVTSATGQAAVYISPTTNPGIYVEWPTVNSGVGTFRHVYRSPPAESGGTQVSVPAPIPVPLTMGTVFRKTAGASYELGIGINGNTPSTVASAQGAIGVSSNLVFGVNFGNAQLRNLTGSYAEFIFYTAELTTSDTQKVQGYLAWKWGLVGSLPNDHPYKNTPVDAIQPLFPNYPQVLQATNVPVFAPTSIAGCTFWLDAMDPFGTGTRGSNGQAITSLKDKSSNAAVGTASTFATVATASINNNDSLSFNGTTAGYIFSNTRINSATHTLFHVVRPTSVTSDSGYTYVWGFQSGSTDPYIVFPYYYSSVGGMKGYITSYDGATLAYTGAGLVDNATANTTTLSCAVIQSGNQQVYRYGSLQSSDTQALSSSNSPSLYVGRFFLGGVNFSGNLCEMIAFDSALSTAQRQQVEGYLAWKWGLINNLPIDHPYRVKPIAPFPFAVRIAGPVPGFWLPTQVAGCQLWLDAYDTSKVTLSGSNIMAITDKSGTNKTITVVNTVTYVTQTAFVFTDSVGRLDVAGLPTPPYDILFVGTANSLSNIYRTLLRSAHPTSADVAFLLNVNTNNVGHFTASGFQQFGSLTQAPSEKAMFYLTNSAGSTQSASKNGTVALTTPTAYTRDMQIGYIGNSIATNQPYGQLHELILFDRTLPTAQRQQVEGYLAWKWGVQKSLPGNHPYFYFPPPPS